MTTRHVTVGVDGSLVAVRALDRACEEAALRGAVLDIVYAVPDLEEAGPVLASAAARVRDRHPGLRSRPVPSRADLSRRRCVTAATPSSPWSAPAGSAAWPDCCWAR
ncbi:universal stress protein [Streptomyces lunaelactis]|uniref:universal stress protein n=1 Tax=Streptomyces lunaelactis TaxID=1535768 RepID=UPI0026A06547|nr:universal stress protein [Streptomyces lunaelactis]